MSEINTSNDTETSGGAPSFDPDPSLANMRYPEDFPEFEDVLLAYSNENPEYRNLLTERTRSLIKDVFLDANNETLPQKTINKNRERTRVRVWYILKQLEESEKWYRMRRELSRTAPGVIHGNEAGRVAANDEEWKAAPRTILKTLQDVFTSPTERLVFQRGEFCRDKYFSRLIERMTEGPRGVDWNEDISCMVIDPATLTATKLKNLGLEEYIPEKGKRMTPAERMAHMAKAIPAIKEILSNLESLRLPFQWHESENNHFRLMRIGSGKKEGYILGTQVIRGKKTIFVTDIHSAYRRLFHIMQESYKEEIKILRELESGILNVHADLAQWPMETGVLESTKRTLKQAALKLKYVTDEDKVEIRRLIDASVDLKTQRTVHSKYSVDPETGIKKMTVPENIIEQINPKATRARLYPARIRKFFQSRMDRIRRISSHLSQDNVVSEDYINRQQIPFDEIMDLFESKTVGVNMARLPTAQSKTRTVSALSRIKKNCSHSQEGASLAQPYLSFSSKVLEHADETLRLMEEGADRTETAAEFMKIYFVAKIQRFYRRLQHVYGRYISPAEVPDFTQLTRELGLLQKNLFQKRVRVSMVKDGTKKEVVLKSKSYSEAYEKLYRFIKQLTDCAGEAAKLQTNYPEKTDDLKLLQKTLRGHVREFGFPELIASIRTNPDEESDYVIEEK